MVAMFLRGGRAVVRWAGPKELPCSNRSPCLCSPLTRSKSGTFSAKHVCPFVPDQPRRDIAEEKQG